MSSIKKNTYVEFHILQSFPVTCLNRDDVGAPKSAFIGGVSRARVSSQCWKRQVRLALQDLGIKTGVRTKKIETLIRQACEELDANKSKKITACAKQISKELSNNTLLFLSASEARTFAQYIQEQNYDASKLKGKKLEKLAKKTLDSDFDALDIALFGRMVAKAPTMNIEAASSFNHAISTHEVANEIDYFTALDDYQDEPGAAHIASLEFNSATYYRYVSLNIGQLCHTLGCDAQNLKTELEAFIKALYIAVPAARQATQSGASPWGFARVLVRQGQRMQAPFERPVKKDPKGGYLEPSVTALKTYLTNKEKLSGSLFGKLAEFEWGERENYSIDHLIDDVIQCIREKA